MARAFDAVLPPLKLPSWHLRREEINRDAVLPSQHLRREEINISTRGDQPLKLPSQHLRREEINLSPALSAPLLVSPLVSPSVVPQRTADGGSGSSNAGRGGGARSGAGAASGHGTRGGGSSSRTTTSEHAKVGLLDEGGEGGSEGGYTERLVAAVSKFDLTSHAPRPDKVD